MKKSKKSDIKLFKQFLKENNCLIEFYVNSYLSGVKSIEELINKEVSTYVSNFFWRSPFVIEGYNYWTEIHKKWCIFYLSNLNNN